MGGDLSNENKGYTEHRYFIRRTLTREPTEKRGLGVMRVGLVETLRHHTRFSQQHDPLEVEEFGHLVLARNPLANDSESPKFVVILNGVSGPATLGLALALTGGGVGSDRNFTAYHEAFRPDIESERIMSKVLSKMKRSNFKALQCVVSVHVGPPSQPPSSPFPANDWRRITGWALDCDVLAETDGVQFF